MGMILYTQSGTFVPSDHGLNVGDTIHIVAVGGGGGGAACGYNTALTSGSAGAASSFGSLVTAAGGSGGSTTPGASGSPGSWGSPPVAADADISAYLSVPIGTSSATVYYTIGGCGANGWLPGESVKQASTSDMLNLLLNPYMVFNWTAAALVSITGLLFPYALHTSAYNVATDGQRAAQTAPRGGYGGIFQNSTNSTNSCIAAGGPGGIGYGAGGGGATSSRYGFNRQSGAPGGNAGAIESVSYTLSSASPASFAVTVGAGGAGANVGRYGGGGARGCVAVFW